MTHHNVFTLLLPYLEQSALYDQSDLKYDWFSTVQNTKGYVNLTATSKDIEELLSDIEDKFKVYKLLLFNDDYHDMVEVMIQIMKAIRCSPERAKALMFEAHNTGSVAVLKGSKDTCQRAQKILEEINLETDLIEEID